MKYIKMVCIACQGAGWNFGTTEEHRKMKGVMGGTDCIKCNFCDGTGIHKAEIVEEKGKSKKK